ncbi:MAG: hypothetical protein QN632_11405, partial [Nitrososphaeraceae archaeon]|nr:hypothetical protein [Nitrososphaeraceae archaeon]
QITKIKIEMAKIVKQVLKVIRYIESIILSRQSIRTGMSPSFPCSYLGFKFNIYHKELWAEQFLRIELLPKWNKTSGKIFRQRLDKNDKKKFDEMFSYS